MTTSPQRDDFDSSRAEKTKRLDTLRQQAMTRVRNAPSATDMARRKFRLNTAKWALPGLAALLLLSIAAWPEINHLLHQNNAVLQEMRQAHTDSGTMGNAIYRDIDTHQHPYTLTAINSHQNNNNRVDLEHPKADILLRPGEWIHVEADHGMYLKHEQTLNLNDHVVIYRSDGTLLNTPSADIDLQQHVIATHDWVHAEGPSGTQDAQGAFFDENTNIFQFLGPGLTKHFDDPRNTPSSHEPQKAP